MPELTKHSLGVTGIRPFLRRLLLQLHLILRRLRQRNDLADIQNQPAIQVMRTQMDAGDIHLVLVEPQHRRRQFSAKVGAGEDDPHPLGKLAFVRLLPIKEIEQVLLRILATAAKPRQESSIDLDRPSPRHRTHHRRVADRLQFHVPAIVGSLEFDNDEVRAAIDAEQVDAPATVLELPELLGDDQRVGADDLHMFAQQALQIAALLHGGGDVAGGRNLDQRLARHLIKRHEGADYTHLANLCVRSPACKGIVHDRVTRDFADF